MGRIKENRSSVAQLGDFSGFFGFLKKCMTHKPWPKVYVEELEAQRWTAWGMRYHKTWKMKIFTKNTFFLEKKVRWHLKKNRKFSKSHFFRRSDLFSKIDFFEKSDFLKIFMFLKNIIGFFFKKNVFFVKIVMVSIKKNHCYMPVEFSHVSDRNS